MSFRIMESKAKIVRESSEILSTGQFTEYTHRFGDFIYQKQCAFNSSYISGLVSEESESLMKEMKEKAAKVCHDFLLLRHQALRLQLEKQYLTMINAIMYQHIIREHFTEAFSQQTLVALVRAVMCEVNQRILLKWTRKYGQYMDNLIKTEKRKHAELEKNMARAQLPASEALSQQVSEELDT